METTISTKYYLMHNDAIHTFIFKCTLQERVLFPCSGRAGCLIVYSDVLLHTRTSKWDQITGSTPCLLVMFRMSRRGFAGTRSHFLVSPSRGNKYYSGRSHPPHAHLLSVFSVTSAHPLCLCPPCFSLPTRMLFISAVAFMPGHQRGSPPLWNGGKLVCFVHRSLESPWQRSHTGAAKADVVGERWQGMLGGKKCFHGFSSRVLSALNTGPIECFKVCRH